MTRHVYFKPTAYARYENFWGHDRSDTIIFNNNYNFGCGNGCSIFCGGGGSSWGNFKKGLFQGLGFGAANWFSNLIFGNTWSLNSFMNTPMYSFNPFGGDMFGGGGSWSPWGRNNRTNADTPTTPSSSTTSKCEDIDSKKLAEFMPKVTELEGNAERKPEDVQKLYDEIKAAKDAQDNNHKDDDTKQYDDLLGRLKVLGATDDTDKKEEPVTTVVEEPHTLTDQVPVEQNPVVLQENDDTKIKIGGKDVNIDGIKNPDGLKLLTRSDLQHITPEQATTILGNLGLKENGELTGKLVKSYGVLLLLEKSGISVKVAKNDHSSVTDHWIAGKISGVKQIDESNEYVQFDINCKGVGQQGNKYCFKQQDNTNFQCSVLEHEPDINYARADVTSVTYTVKGDEEPLHRDDYKFTTRH